MDEFKMGDRVRIGSTSSYGELTGLVDGELSQVLWDGSKLKTWVKTDWLVLSAVRVMGTALTTEVSVFQRYPSLADLVVTASASKDHLKFVLYALTARWHGHEVDRCSEVTQPWQLMTTRTIDRSIGQSCARDRDYLLAIAEIAKTLAMMEDES
jgi:hypothetical protein